MSEARSRSPSVRTRMLPAPLFDPELRPTKVDRPSDVVNLVDTGELVGILSKDDATAVMESIYRISDMKMQRVSPGLGVTPDESRIGTLVASYG